MKLPHGQLWPRPHSAGRETISSRHRMAPLLLTQQMIVKGILRRTLVSGTSSPKIKMPPMSKNLLLQTAPLICMRGQAVATGEHRRSMNVITKQSVPVGKANRHLRGEVDEVLASLKALDLNILRWLLRYPFSRVEDVTKALVRVENPSRKHGREKPLDDATVYRHLEFHQELDLVESVIAPSLGKQRARLYHLSNLGLHVLAANMHPPRSASALARKCRTDEQGLLALLPRLASLVTLQDLINGIDTLAPRQLA